MKRSHLITLLLAFVAFTGYFPAMAQDAATILAKMDKIMFSPKDKQGKIKIILIDKNREEKVREATMMQKGPDRKLYRYTQPESQAGVATLSLPGDVMWLYMPAWGKPRKISLLARNQSFTGTDFSYEDMGTIPYSDRYTPELLKTEKETYLLQLTPKSDKSKYGKIIARIDKTNGYPILLEFYDGRGQKFKEATYRYEKIGNYWNAAEVLMTDLNKKHSTKILLTGVKFDQGLADEIFTVEKLKK
jgi:outer membrane lipoprotein-sorting protein